MALQTVREVTAGLHNGRWNDTLSRIYGDDASRAAGRLLALVGGFCDFYGADADTTVALYSCPGRTELGGNHTDHQRGHALAASVDLDTIACVHPNESGVIRVKSQYHRIAEIDLAHLEPQQSETGRSPSLVRGIAARIASMGYPVSGFDAYTTTQVLRGGGLSSSAAFEVLVGEIINHLCCGGELTARQLAQIAQWSENEYFGKPCGVLDQMVCATGGVIAIDFGGKDRPEVRHVDFDLRHAGYALCIVDTGFSHADLKEDFAAIPREMRAVASCFGKELLSQVSPTDFYASLPEVRRRCGDRAVLRAIHFFVDDALVGRQLQAISRGDIETFLSLVSQSGRSSYMYLQNVSTYRDPSRQDMAVLLAVAEQLLEGRGACRVHGGGFAGTIQTFVPLDMVESFCTAMEAVAGKNACHVLSFRSTGTCCIID